MSTLRDLARAAYDAHGCSEQGTECLLDKVAAAGLEAQALAQYAADALREQEREFRASLTTSGGAPRTFTADQQAQVESACKGFLVWPLMDHTPLGQATREQVKKDRERWQALAQGNARSARFLGLVAAKLSHDGQRVGEVLNEKQLARLFERAQRG
jgi:hypothetical protein